MIKLKPSNLKLLSYVMSLKNNALLIINTINNWKT